MSDQDQVVTPEESTVFADLLNTVPEDIQQKYHNDPAEMIKSVAPAQEHIQKLENEMAELRTELEKRKSVEEAMLEVQQKSDEGRQPSPELDVNKLAEIIDDRLSAKSSAEVAKNNVRSVIDTMTEAYGDKAESEYQRIAKDNGLSIDYMNELAAKSPELVVKLAGIENKANMPSSVASSVNTTSFQQQGEPQSLKFKRGSSMNDMVSVWREAGKQVKAELGELNG